jgi:MFS transporter, DHA2 family, multidrug resistance protein
VPASLILVADRAADIAKECPQHSSQIISAAKESFIQGQHAYASGVIAVILGGIVVGFFFPGLKREKELLASYQRVDSARSDMALPARSGVPVA